MILSFIGGYLIDKVFGVRLGAIIFASFCLAGQVRYRYSPVTVTLSSPAVLLSNLIKVIS